MIRRSWVQLAFVVAVALIITSTAEAQRKRRKRAPDVSQGATVSQTIGTDTHITIVYHRPGVKGRAVWTAKSDNANIGRMVPHDGDPRPWRAGANEATTISLDGDVTVEGQKLAAGTYTLFMIPTDGDWTVVFNSQAVQWGSFRYKSADDALRVEVTPVDAPHQEWLAYGFDNLDTYAATAFLRWEKKKIPFRIEVTESE